MALSDRERRLLAEMEAALATDDPRLQSTLAGSATSTLTQSLTRGGSGSALVGFVIVLAGIGTLFGGLIAQITLLGIAGFILALAGLLTVLRALSGKKVSGIRAPKTPRSMGARLQQRWDQRNFDQ